MDEINRIRETAYHSVGRACLFGMLAVATVMAGLIAWPTVAFRSGAILSTLGMAILLIKAEQAKRRSYRHSEVWVLLGRRQGLPEARAQQVIASVLSATFERFAVYLAVLSGVMWVCAFGAWVAAGA